MISYESYDDPILVIINWVFIPHGKDLSNCLAIPEHDANGHHWSLFLQNPQRSPCFFWANLYHVVAAFSLSCEIRFVLGNEPRPSTSYYKNWWHTHCQSSQIMTFRNYLWRLSKFPQLVHSHYTILYKYIFLHERHPSIPLANFPNDTVDGCEILHHQKDGWNPIGAGFRIDRFCCHVLLLTPNMSLLLWLVGALEPWNFMNFPSYWECYHPNWRTPSFFRGVGQPPTRWSFFWVL